MDDAPPPTAPTPPEPETDPDEARVERLAELLKIAEDPAVQAAMLKAATHLPTTESE
jgi:hypothetical protein